ncbi:hypothetical protein SGFS_070010 [Streptomyces graminofaciens]|jgi:hypothetical protein|uniref:Uncharacterized protein n=1 Tax=Streptomyces graminofaciens TaxID=68212 RepID=A0ABM7FHR8_9ACTN|nr:hypothetical protein SGFS_070010 [Streptomyces graminofaciens]
MKEAQVERLMSSTGPSGFLEEWQRRHTRETGRVRHRRSFGDYAVLEPPEEVAR